MDEYIKREDVIKVIGDNCPHDKGGYNTEEEMGVGAACYYIMQDVEKIPTADVAPRAEVDLYKRLNDELEDELAATYDKLENARAEVAREIFEDIRNAMFPILIGTSYFDDYCSVMAELEKKHMKGE